MNDGSIMYARNKNMRNFLKQYDNAQTIIKKYSSKMKSSNSIEGSDLN